MHEFKCTYAPPDEATNHDAVANHNVNSNQDNEYMVSNNNNHVDAIIENAPCTTTTTTGEGVDASSNILNSIVTRDRAVVSVAECLKMMLEKVKKILKKQGLEDASTKKALEKGYILF